MTQHFAVESPSDWVVRWAPLVARGPVLDVACGGGRHARLFRDRGLDVVAVDRKL
jgi:2-polyprenyl-3-methyl-5-hydroxy-6-metoxy-1,4-benzoquinol methylase